MKLSKRKIIVDKIFQLLADEKLNVSDSSKVLSSAYTTNRALLLKQKKEEQEQNE